jgi:hypothetical protein
VSRGEQAVPERKKGLELPPDLEDDRPQHIREVLRAETAFSKRLGLRVKIEGCDIGGRGTFDALFHRESFA